MDFNNKAYNKFKALIKKHYKQDKAFKIFKQD